MKKTHANAPLARKGRKIVPQVKPQFRQGVFSALIPKLQQAVAAEGYATPTPIQEQCIPQLIQPNEIANVALFLASDLSQAITGQEVLVDRGWSHAG